jgi:lipopolysaccharide biosynthesis protein
MKFFREDTGVGLIGSEEWRATDIASNAEKFEEMLNLFGIESQHRNVEYLSGTMFLIRPQIVQRLFDVLKNLELESGDNQTLNFNMDGQLAHAIERVVGNVVRQLGYRIQWVTS